VRFNSVITNEEALMLQTLKEKMGLKLYNPEVRAFQKFLGYYQKASGNRFWTTDNDAIMKKSDFVIALGSALRNDAPGMKYAFNNVQKMNKGAGLYFHPIGDTLIPSFGKSVECFTHKPGLEEAALYLVLDLFADKEKLPEEVREYLAGFKTTETKTVKEKVMKDVTETVVDEETGESKEVTKKVPEMVEKEVSVEKNGLVDLLGGDSATFTDTFEKMMKKKESFSMMIGEDFYYHEKAENLARLIALIEETCEIDVVMAPPKANALGVALICDLDDEAEGYTIGYNEVGDFRLSALGDGDLDMPAMNQQEGTFTNISKRVVPTNAALEYGGYELNDTSNRKVKTPSVEKFDESAALEGEIVYRCNPARQFSDFSDKAHEIFEPFGLYASVEKAEALGKKVEYDLFGPARYQTVTMRKV